MTDKKKSALDKGSKEYVTAGDVRFGETFQIIAGPCSVESREQIMVCAEAVAAQGGKIIRGGAFKPRTSPYSFQGLEEDGLKYIRDAADKFGLLVISEVMDTDLVPLLVDYVDILQVGARNMANFRLLRRLGLQKKPVLLKRGFGSTVEELLLASEYLTSGGNSNVILCERGIRTFEPRTRFTLDLSSIPIIKKLCRLPVIVDPSHATGRADLILPMSRAALAAGADGLMIEIHPKPAKALCDGLQSLDLDHYRRVVAEMNELIPILFGRDQ